MCESTTIESATAVGTRSEGWYGCICNYPSEPILTFGAAYLWYRVESEALAKYTLPHIRKLVMRNLVHTRDAGEVAAHIVLLVAMDKCRSATSGGLERGYTGEFYPVTMLLRVLHGPKPGFRTSPNKSSDTRETVNAQEAWGGVGGIVDGLGGRLQSLCPVGDGHGRDPTEAMLWTMLASWAAGIFPRGCDELDLFISIIKRTGGDDGDGSDDDAAEKSQPEVSVILVRVVTDSDEEDGHFPDSAAKDPHPKRVFGSDNPLYGKLPEDVLRVYMSLGSAPPSESLYYVYTARTSIEASGFQSEDDEGEDLLDTSDGL